VNAAHFPAVPILKRTKRLMAFAALAVAAGLGVAQAATAADDAIKARQEAMKANAKAMGALVSILKGETAYDSAMVQQNVTAIKAAEEAADAAKVWDAGSQTGSIDTFAKPEVWSDAAGFAAARGKLDKALAALAATGDEASFKSVFPQLGSACKGCHETYRRPKD